MKGLLHWSAITVCLMATTAIPLNAVADNFQIPFTFRAGSLDLPRGHYIVERIDDQHIKLLQTETGQEFELPIVPGIDGSASQNTQPRLVFDVVGDSKPSYTEYMTRYVLADAWLRGLGRVALHITKGAHGTRAILAEEAK